MSLYETVGALLERQGLEGEGFPDAGAWHVRVQGDHGTWSLLAQVREAAREVLLYSVCPVQAPAERRAAMAELVTLANYGMILGNFELDFDDGEVRFKTSTPVVGDAVDEALLVELLAANLGTMDEYLPALLELLHGTATPAEALALVEG